MEIYTGNESFITENRQTKTTLTTVNSLGKLINRVCNAVLPSRSGNIPQSPPVPDIGPPLKNADRPILLTQVSREQVIVDIIKLRSHLPTLNPLMNYIQDDNNEITYDKIEYLIHERVSGGEKHNFLRVLITDLDLCSKPENGDANNKNLALAILQKEICGCPFKSYGNLNVQQHSEVFTTDGDKLVFKEQMIAVLEYLKFAWNFATAETDESLRPDDNV